jgi:hypothetical protein
VCAAAALTLVLAGCGDDGGSPASGGEPSGSSTATPMLGSEVGRVDVPGAQRPVVLTRQSHPRGGYQLHLYVDLGDGARELVDVDHNPVIPFVATDTRPANPVSADCTKDGFAVTTADPSGSRGGQSSWDVHRTGYRVDGDRAVPLDRVAVATAVPDAQLHQELPELFSHAMFRHC